MKLKQLLFFFLFYLATIALLPGNAQSQEVTATSGGNFQGSVHSISYTIGEMATTTLDGGGIILTQGFQQPRLIVTAISELVGITYSIKAYPNPTTDVVNLSTDQELPAGSLYQLFDMNGSRMDESQLDGLVTEISVEALVPAVYLLKIINSNQTLKTFKIIKK